MTTKTKTKPLPTKKPARVKHATPAPAPDQRLRESVAALIEAHQAEVAALQAELDRTRRLLAHREAKLQAIIDLFSVERGNYILVADDNWDELLALPEDGQA